MVITLLMSCAFSILDQGIRFFLLSRRFDAGDLAFDAIGYLCAIGISIVFCKLKGRFERKEGNTQ